MSLFVRRFRRSRLLASAMAMCSVGAFVPLLVGCTTPTTVCNSMVFNTNLHTDGLGVVHVYTSQNICVAPDGTVTSNTGSTNTAQYGAYAPVVSTHPLADSGYTGPTTDIQGWEQWIGVNVTLQVTVELKAFGIVITESNTRCNIRFIAEVVSGGDKVDSYAIPLNNLNSGSCGAGFTVSNAT